MTEKRRTLGPPAVDSSNEAKSGFFAVSSASHPDRKRDPDDQEGRGELHGRAGNAAMRD
jgi:hypothetical protein